MKTQNQIILKTGGGPFRSGSVKSGSRALALTGNNTLVLIDDHGNETPVDGGGGGGATNFTELDDTPSAYTGANGRPVVVNPGGTGLMFGDFPSGFEPRVEDYVPTGTRAQTPLIVADQFYLRAIVPGTAGNGVTVEVDHYDTDPGPGFVTYYAGERKIWINLWTSAWTGAGGTGDLVAAVNEMLINDDSPALLVAVNPEDGLNPSWGTVDDAVTAGGSDVHEEPEAIGQRWVWPEEGRVWVATSIDPPNWEELVFQGGDFSGGSILLNGSLDVGSSLACLGQGTFPNQTNASDSSAITRRLLPIESVWNAHSSFTDAYDDADSLGSDGAIAEIYGAGCHLATGTNDNGFGRARFGTCVMGGRWNTSWSTGSAWMFGIVMRGIFSDDNARLRIIVGSEIRTVPPMGDDPPLTAAGICVEIGRYDGNHIELSLMVHNGSSMGAPVSTFIAPNSSEFNHSLVLKSTGNGYVEMHISALGGSLSLRPADAVSLYYPVPFSLAGNNCLVEAIKTYPGGSTGEFTLRNPVWKTG